jgi:hypothetical protein
MRKTQGKRKEAWFFTFGFAFFSLYLLRTATDPIDKQQQAKSKSIYLCMVIGRMPQQLKYILLFFSFYFGIFYEADYC